MDWHAYVREEFPQYVVEEIPGDGNCCFSSIGAQLRQVPVLHSPLFGMPFPPPTPSRHWCPSERRHTDTHSTVPCSPAVPPHELRQRIVRVYKENPKDWATIALASASADMIMEIDQRVGCDAPDEDKFPIYTEILARNGVWAGAVEIMAAAISQFVQINVLRLWRCEKTGSILHDLQQYLPQSSYVRNTINLLETPNHFDILVDTARYAVCCVWCARDPVAAYDDAVSVAH